MEEIWKDVVGYEGLYQVSNLGNVKNNKKIKKTYKRKDGYLNVQLSKNKKIKTFLVHQLVAKMFLKNENKYKEINHKNEIKDDNRVDNLEWCDRSYNINYGTAKFRGATKHFKKVNQYSLQGNLIKTWDSISEASNVLKIKLPHIVRVCRGGRKTTGGYIWRYNNE